MRDSRPQATPTDIGHFWKHIAVSILTNQMQQCSNKATLQHQHHNNRNNNNSGIFVVLVAANVDVNVDSHSAHRERVRGYTPTY
jgi:hypothetical protein